MAKTTEQFVRDAKEKHGELYDYSLTEYINAHTSVTIICRIHGEFPQRPNDHLTGKGKGCPKCGGINRSDRRRKPLEMFIKEAKEKHGDVYDYSLVKYVNTSTKVTIICPQHGEFRQRPCDHLRYGCRKCGLISNFDKRRKSLEMFIKEAKEKHGDIYDYSLVKYVNVDTKVFIVCYRHGAFQQRPGDHITGHGCPECGIISSSDKYRKNRLEARIAKWRKIGSDLRNK
jgi:predicted RNA-binding Zn-ribbon protein involved in translation (DUF1610 family)